MAGKPSRVPRPFAKPQVRVIAALDDPTYHPTASEEDTLGEEVNRRLRNEDLDNEFGWVDWYIDTDPNSMIFVPQTNLFMFDDLESLVEIVRDVLDQSQAPFKRERVLIDANITRVFDFTDDN